MRWTRTLAFALVAIVGVALIATGYGVAQLTSVETEVRVVARPHEDGRVEFAVQQRVDGEWGERIAPSSRYLTPRLIEERVGRWLNSSPITLTVVTNGSATDGGTDELTEPPPQPNRAPIANAGPGALLDLSENAVRLYGVGSRDPDGDNLTYEWTQTAGPTVALRNPRSATAWFESPRVEQTLTFQLRVADEDGATSTATVSVQFTNARPTAEAGDYPHNVGRGREFTLRGGGSDDAPEGNLIYRWSQVSGSPVELSDPASASPTFTTPNEPSDLVFSLIVSDGQNESHPDTATIRVRNAIPDANAGSDMTVDGGSRVILDGTASRDSNGDRLTFSWTQIQGNEVRLINPTTAQPHFTAPHGGQTLIFQLEVSDGYSRGTPAIVRITVADAPITISGSGDDAQTMAGMTRGVYFCDVELIGGNTNRYTSSSHFSVWMHGRDGGSELVVNEIVYVSPWSVRRRVVVGSGWRDLRGAVDAVINSEGRWTITCTRQ